MNGDVIDKSSVARAAAIGLLLFVPLWAIPAAVVKEEHKFETSAWGIVPVHLNELSPRLARGVFPGVAYQLGNLIASRNAPFQAWCAKEHGGNYGLALALVAGVTAVVIAIWGWAGGARSTPRAGARSGSRGRHRNRQPPAAAHRTPWARWWRRSVGLPAASERRRRQGWRWGRRGLGSY